MFGVLTPDGLRPIDGEVRPMLLPEPKLFGRLNVAEESNGRRSDPLTAGDREIDGDREPEL